MKTRHIAFLGFTASSFLAMAIAGCSAATTAAPVKKDAGATTGGTGGASGTTTAAGGGGDTTTTGTGAPGGTLDNTGGGGGMALPCTAPDKTMKAVVATAVLADFEGMAPGAVSAVTPGGGWYSYQDPEVGTMFTPAPASWMVETPGNGGMGSAVHVAGTGFMGPASATNWGAGTGMSLGGAIAGGTTGMTTQPTDVSTYKGISFFAKSSMMSDVSVQFSTPDTDPSYCSCQALSLCYTTHAKVVPMLAADWTKYTVMFTDLTQPTYVMTPVPFDPTSLLTINFASNGPLAAFDFWIDDVTLITQ